MTDVVAQSETDEPNPEMSAGPFGEQDAHVPFPVVGIGASAGGLEAFRQLLAALPPDTGMAFVLVQHLDPRHESRLTDL
ncbi:MAG TPA: chemotaxis protein CheB, partial [Gemmatimonadaceae bacterium]|nr:chemotaxis protein CheB [Gemmatimonadaceae bacterium]